MPEVYFEICANHHIHPNDSKLCADISLAHLISTPYSKEKETYQILRILSLNGFVRMKEGKKEFSKIEFKKNLQPCVLCLWIIHV